jgi:protein TonB
MNCQQQSIAASLVIHGLVIFLVYALSGSFAQPSRPIEIDFTVLEPSGPPSPNPAPPGPKTKEPQPKHEEIRRQVPTRALPAPTTHPVVQQEPASEPQGTVPILVNPRQDLPEPTIQQSTAGTGTSGSGRNGSGGGSDSGGGDGSSAEQLRIKYRAEHFVYIRNIIQRNLSYPLRAQRYGWSGSCIVSFVVLENGHATDIRILKSTGYGLLDDNVINTVKKVEPFPRPPVKAEIKIPVSYGLE